MRILYLDILVFGLTSQSYYYSVHRFSIIRVAKIHTSMPMPATHGLRLAVSIIFSMVPSNILRTEGLAVQSQAGQLLVPL